MKKPYIPQELPPENIDWKELVPFIAKANEALARYDGILQSLINPEVLLSPLTTKEAVISSKIEGTQATLEDVLEMEAGIKNKKNENLISDIQEIINYRQALKYAEKELEHRPITLNLIKQIHYILMQGVRGQKKRPGEFRDTQNWIGAPGTPIEQARFVPPNPLIVPEFMEKLVNFIQSDYIDTIVQTAIIHAQFEIIHPFLDGNGRIGRLLIPLFLFYERKISRPMFYISEFLEKNRQLYYDNLLAISENNDWQQWIKFFLQAVTIQANENLNKAKQILNLYEQLKSDFVKTTHSQFAIYILDAFFTKPIINTADLSKLSNINKNTLRPILNKLLENNLIQLIQKASGRQPAVYALKSLIEIIG